MNRNVAPSRRRAPSSTLLCCPCSLQHRKKIFDTQVTALLRERDALVSALAAYPWLTPMPSDSNFVLFEVHAPAKAADVVTTLRRRGVLIRCTFWVFCAILPFLGPDVLSCRLSRG